MEKLEWLGYPMVKNFEDIFIRFHATHERDRQTDRQTPHADIGRAYALHRAAKMCMLESVAQSVASCFGREATCRFLIKYCCRLKSWTYFYWSCYLFKLGL